MPAAPRVPFRPWPVLLAGCLLIPGASGWSPAASAADPPPVPPTVIVRGRRIPVLPRRVARMEARGEILELRPQPPAAPPVVIVEQAPPIVIRERVTDGLAGRLPGRLGLPADVQAARPFRPQGIAPATAVAPEPGPARVAPAAPQPQPPSPPAAEAEPLPPIELLPTP